MKELLLLSVLYILTSCSDSPAKRQQYVEREIMDVEKAFSDMAQSTSVKEAFIHFAADEAVLNRNGQIIKGKREISEYFDSQTLQNVSLSWQPEFIDVSRDGDMAYTYGPFTFSAIDTTGKKIESKGYFHTVWKRQDDGSWKYVYD